MWYVFSFSGIVAIQMDKICVQREQIMRDWVVKNKNFYILSLPDDDFVEWIFVQFDGLLMMRCIKRYSESRMVFVTWLLIRETLSLNNVTFYGSKYVIFV